MELQKTTNWYQERIIKAKTHQSEIYQAGINRLSFIKREKKRIWLEENISCIEFMSCSYLGLEQNEQIINNTSEKIKKYGVQFSASRTRMSPDVTYQFEELLQSIFLAPTVTFATCGLVHLAIFPLLGSKEMPSFKIKNNGILWILDNTAHASIQILKALLQQFGEVVRIDFQNENEIINAFEKAVELGKTPISVSDGIGSMGGNAPVQLLLNCAEKYDGFSYIDDAHGTSIYAQKGGGFVINELGNKFHDRLILCSSLSKAFGATGGSVTVANLEDAEFIRRYSNPYIFGGPLSLPGVLAGIESVRIHNTPILNELQNKLYENIKYFDSLECKFKILIKNALIPIRGVLIGDEKEAINFCKILLNKGFATTCATYPTVPKGKAMFRVALSALHTKFEIENLIVNINSFAV